MLNSRKFIVKLVENWPAKVISVACALVLFVFHQMNTLTSRPISVPLTVETSPLMLPASAYPRNVRITLRGEDDSVRSIAENDIEAYADFSQYETEGLYRVPVQIRKRGTALGIEPLEIAVTPLEVSVRLDRKISKTIPLTAAFRGSVASGFDFVSHTIFPTEIMVTGPLGLLESVSGIQTDAVELDGKSDDFSIMVNIVNPNPLFVLPENGTAEITGVVRPLVPARNITGLPILPTGLAPRLRVEFGGRKGSVRLEGRQPQLDNFNPPPGFLSVDCSGLSEGSYMLPVLVNLPAGFFLIRREPELLELTILPVEDEENDESEGGENEDQS